MGTLSGTNLVVQVCLGRFRLLQLPLQPLRTSGNSGGLRSNGRQLALLCMRQGAASVQELVPSPLDTRAASARSKEATKTHGCFASQR
jgi:hypothetical protein